MNTCDTGTGTYDTYLIPFDMKYIPCSSVLVHSQDGNEIDTCLVHAFVLSTGNSSG